MFYEETNKHVIFQDEHQDELLSMLIFILRVRERGWGNKDIGEKLTHFQAPKPDAGNVYYDIQDFIEQSIGKTKLIF